MFLLLATTAAPAIACGCPLVVADHLTRTAWYQTKVIPMIDSDPVTADELDSFDDLTGVDLDGNGDDGITTVDAPWLSSLLYSDYADPSDDDDRAGMDIPRSVLDYYVA